MYKIMISMMLLIVALAAHSAYQVGDVVENFTWNDSNLDEGGNIVVTERNVYEIIDSGKVLLIDFGFTG